jgi:hypothetical protein
VGFELNPYESCVANKQINGQKCTIIWHVDDLKISPMDDKVVSEMITRIEQVFGKEAPLTVTRGKIYEYLGMSMNFSKKER